MVLSSQLKFFSILLWEACERLGTLWAHFLKLQQALWTCGFCHNLIPFSGQFLRSKVDKLKPQQKGLTSFFQSSHFFLGALKKSDGAGMQGSRQDAEWWFAENTGGGQRNSMDLSPVQSQEQQQKTLALHQSVMAKAGFWGKPLGQTLFCCGFKLMLQSNEALDAETSITRKPFCDFQGERSFGDESESGKLRWAVAGPFVLQQLSSDVPFWSNSCHMCLKTSVALFLLLSVLFFK